MALLKSKKEEIVQKLAKGLKESEAVVFVNFHGLKVADESALRRVLGDQGITYQVARKTLLKKASSGIAEGELPVLEGEVAIAYAKGDQIAPAREVYNFSKTHGNVLSIIGGIFAGKFVDGAYMHELATIPSREVLLSKIAFLLKSPMQRLAIAVNEVAKTK